MMDSNTLDRARFQVAKKIAVSCHFLSLLWIILQKNTNYDISVMHRVPTLASYSLAAYDHEYFLNSKSNDLLLHTKYIDQNILISPMTNRGEAVMNMTTSNIKITGVGGVSIMTDSNFMYEALKVDNSNQGPYAGVLMKLTNDKGDSVIRLTGNHFDALSNSLSNSTNILTIANQTGDIIITPECGIPSIFMASNTGYVGVHTTMPITTLHVQASNTSPHGHLLVERTNPGSFGGQVTIKNSSHTKDFNNAATLAFQLHRFRDPYIVPGGYEVAHASIGAFLDSNGADYTSLRFQSLGVEKMRIATDGKVGMGVSNPIAELHVRSLYDTSAMVYLGSNDRLGYSMRKHTDGSLNFFRGELFHETFVMNMLSNGFIGMGVSNPVTDLHIQTEAQTTANIHLGSNDHWGYNMQKRVDGSLHFFSGQWAVPPTAKRYSVTMLNNGNVGIMNSNPTTPLHIYASESNIPTYNGVLLYQQVPQCNAIIAIQTQQTGAPFYSLSVDPANPIGWSLGIDPHSTPLINNLTIKNDWNWGSMALLNLDLQGSNLKMRSMSETSAPTLTLASSNDTSFITLYGGDIPNGSTLAYTTDSFFTIGHRSSPFGAVTERARISSTGKMAVGSSNTYGTLTLAQDIANSSNIVVIEAGNTTDLRNPGFSAINFNGYTSNAAPYTNSVSLSAQVLNTAGGRSRWRWFVDQRRYQGLVRDAMGMDVFWGDGSATTCNVFTILKNGCVGMHMTPFDTDVFYPTSVLHVYNEGTPNSTAGAPLNTGLIISNSNVGHAINMGVCDSPDAASNAYGWIQGANACNAAFKCQLSLQPVGGWVGIGTSNPVSTLQVRSWGSNTGTIYMGLNSNDGYSITKEGNGSLHIQSGPIATPYRRLTLDTNGRLALHNSNPVMDVQFKNATDKGVEILLGSNDPATGYLFQKTDAGNLNIMRGNETTKSNIMSLTTQGRVGINQLSPVTDLHIKNNTPATNSACIYFGNNTAVGYMIDKTPAGSLVFSRGTTAASNLVLTMDTSGNIGVRTSTMTEIINIGENTYIGASGRTVSLGVDSSTSARLGLVGRNAALPMVTASLNNPIVFGFTNNAKIFEGTYTERMRLTYAGNLGIGTATPNQRLDVNGATNISGDLACHNITSREINTQGYKIDCGTINCGTINSGAVNSGAITADGRITSLGSGRGANWDHITIRSDESYGYLSAGGADNGLRIQVRATTTALDTGTYTDVMTLLPGGNVGIGTTTPDTKLQVSGDIKCTNMAATGTLTVDGVSTLNDKLTISKNGLDVSGNANFNDNVFVNKELTIGDSTKIIRKSTDANKTGVLEIVSTNVDILGIGYISGVFNCGGTANFSSDVLVDGDITCKKKITGKTLSVNSIISPIASSIINGAVRLYDDYNVPFNASDGIAVTPTALRKLWINTVSTTGSDTKSGNLIFPQGTYISSTDSYDGTGIIFRKNSLDTNISGMWGIAASGGKPDLLAFFVKGKVRAHIVDNNNSTKDLNFTGQHRNTFPSYNRNIDYTGLIVRSSGTYQHIDSNVDHIDIDESLPVIELCSKSHDKACFGVVSSVENIQEKKRTYELGAFSLIYDKIEGEGTRVLVNAVGEGAIWVCNENGNLENGDYITTSSLPGYGMRQADDVLHNYTVAKITCDCDFDNPMHQITKTRIITGKDGKTYKCAFVGCTYHCG
jgi:hypothetical protein